MTTRHVAIGAPAKTSEATLRAKPSFDGRDTVMKVPLCPTVGNDSCMRQAAGELRESIGSAAFGRRFHESFEALDFVEVHLLRIRLEILDQSCTIRSWKRYEYLELDSLVKRTSVR